MIQMIVKVSVAMINQLAIKLMGPMEFRNLQAPIASSTDTLCSYATASGVWVSELSRPC